MIDFTSVKQKANTAWSQNSLLHREALLVAPTHDLENVSIELLQIKQLIKFDHFL